jgi:hypothetical protein
VTKLYSKKWQVYFVRLLQNVPLIIPKERTKEERVKGQAAMAALMAMSSHTMFYRL